MVTLVPIDTTVRVTGFLPASKTRGNPRLPGRAHGQTKAVAAPAAAAAAEYLMKSLLSRRLLEDIRPSFLVSNPRLLQAFSH
jgi:hypothetical protein